MPRKNFYISEADEKEVYEKAKRYAGESISSVIVDALKVFVAKQEALEKGLEEIKLWDGVMHRDSTCEGNYVRFLGKLLAEESCKKGLTIEETTKLYYTKKGKYLLYKEEKTCVVGKTDTICKYEVIDSIAGLKGRRLSSAMIEEAERIIPDLLCKNLDV